MSTLSSKNSQLNQQTVVQTNSDKRFFIKINKGFDKGSVYQLSSNEVLLGRDPSNHIQLKNDSKISRHHVRLLFNNNKYMIQDITKNNFISVNGIKVKQAELKNNEIIQVGDHILQFVVSDSKTDASKNSGHKYAMAKTDLKTQKIRIGLAVVLAFGAFLYLTQPTGPKVVPKVETFETEQSSERRIDSLNDSIAELDEKLKDSLFATENGRNANAVYIQGKRDFDRGQFFYARDAFSAVLSLEPNHAEARRMLRLSQQFSDDLLEKQFKEGLASKDVGRFEMCKSAMKNIINLINDPSNPRYREAKKIMTECDLKKRGNF